MVEIHYYLIEQMVADFHQTIMNMSQLDSRSVLESVQKVCNKTEDKDTSYFTNYGPKT